MLWRAWFSGARGPVLGPGARGPVLGAGDPMSPSGTGEADDLQIRVAHARESSHVGVSNDDQPAVEVEGPVPGFRQDALLPSCHPGLVDRRTRGKPVLESPFIESYQRVCTYNMTRMVSVKLPNCKPNIDPIYTYPVALRCACGSYIKFYFSVVLFSDDLN
uniref:Glycoprotein hormone subunit beta domain-containing protein n=1 Tax=Poecilia mexicana TaxID=48701 RepID=A0A3B3XPZ7_9TELE